MRVKLLVATVFSLSLLTLGVNAQSATNLDSLNQRVLERKARIQERLTTMQQTRIERRCQNAQARIIKAKETAEKFNQKHDKKIQKLLDKLSEFSKRQENKGADTAILSVLLTDTLKKEEAVKTAYNDYINALSDSSVIDCQIDPTGFLVSLDDARIQFQTLKIARQDLRKSLRNDLLKALESFKLKEGN
ncbi:MAG TPA: hypothetical protein VFW77_02745 [Candidatus Saccharimonadales bacterium]|nr:hypothetical protein [Candidatus Saccharimonadales bacterium]